MSGANTPVYDVVVIGGGVVGCAVLRELSRYDLRLLLVERESDLAEGVSKGNSGVIHAGFNVPARSLKARTNVAGLGLIYPLASTLGVPHRKTGKLVVALADEDRRRLEELKAARRPERRPRSRDRRRSGHPPPRAPGPRPLGPVLPPHRDHLPLRVHRRPGRVRRAERGRGAARDPGDRRRLRRGPLPALDAAGDARGPPGRQQRRPLFRRGRPPGRDRRLPDLPVPGRVSHHGQGQRPASRHARLSRAAARRSRARHPRHPDARGPYPPRAERRAGRGQARPGLDPGGHGPAQGRGRPAHARAGRRPVHPQLRRPPAQARRPHRPGQVRRLHRRGKRASGPAGSASSASNRPG